MKAEDIVARSLATIIAENARLVVMVSDLQTKLAASEKRRALAEDAAESAACELHNRNMPEGQATHDVHLIVD